MHYLVVAGLVILAVYLFVWLLRPRRIPPPQHPGRVYHDEECAICLDRKNFPVQASCGHEFCAECILGSLDRISGCPLCRRPISVLFKNFDQPCSPFLKVSLMKYNTFHDDRSVFQIICEAPLLIKRFFTRNDYENTRTTGTVIALLVIAVAYILQPVDLFDENEYGLAGMIDDFGVVGGTIIYVSLIIFKAILEESFRV